MNLHPIFCIGNEETTLVEICEYLNFHVEFVDLDYEFSAWEDSHGTGDGIDFINQHTVEGSNGWLDGGCFISENGDMLGLKVKPMNELAKSLYDELLPPKSYR